MENKPDVGSEVPRPKNTVEDIQEIQATEIDPKTGQPLNTPAVAQITNAKTATDKKKSKKTIILAIVAGLLAISAIVATVFFCIWYNKPEVVAFNAIKNVYKAENVSMDGTIKVNISEDASSDEEIIKNVEVKLNGAVSGKTSNTTNVDINLTAVDGTKLKFNVGEAFMKDGVIYIKIDGIQKAIKKLEQKSSEAKAYTSMFEKSIKLADGQWWKISVPDVIKHLEDKKLIEDGSSISKAYACIIESINNQKNSDQIFDMYEKNQFINIEKYNDNKITATQGGKLYKLKIDAQKTVDFSKELQESDAVKQLSDCFKKIDKDETGIGADATKEDLNVSEVEEEIEELPEIVLEISKWQHKLLGIHTENKEDDSTSTMDLSLAYPKSIELNAPEDTQSINKLIDQFITEIGTANLLYGNSYSGLSESSAYNLNGTNTNINTNIKDYSTSF